MQEKPNAKHDLVLSNMHQPPKNLNLNFVIGMEAEDFLRLNSKSGSLYYINFSSPFTLNNDYYNNEIPENDWPKLNVLVGKKIVSAEFCEKGKGDIKLTFNSGDKLIIHEYDRDIPYESYTMQTPEGLVVV